MAYNLDNNKNKVKDIRKNIEHINEVTKDLEKNKQEVIKAGMEIQGANIDDKAKKLAMDGVNKELDSISDRGKEIAKETENDIANIEILKQETQDSKESNETERKKLETKKAFLDKLGLGKGLEASINELDNNKKDLDLFNGSLTETGKELNDLHRRLNGL